MPRRLRSLPEVKERPKGFLSPDEAAEKWGVSPQSVHSFVRRGRVPFAVRMWMGKFPFTFVPPERPEDRRFKAARDAEREGA